MKSRSRILPSILVTAVVVSAGWILVLWQWNRVQRMRLVSDVVAPMSVVIDDLTATAQQGRHELLRQKLEVLSRHWEAFRRREDVPSGFWSTIVRMGATNEVAPGPVSPGAKARVDRVGP